MVAGHVNAKCVASSGEPAGSGSKHVDVDGTYHPFETHQSHIYPPFLEGLGYKTETLGNRDQMGANITAWKHVKGAPAAESA